MEFSARFLRLKDVLLSAGAPKYRLDQLIRQLYGGKVTAVADLKSLGTHAQKAIETQFGPNLLTLNCVSVSEAPRATKVLFECKDGVRIEAVALKFASHTSLCISSQAGCSFNCSFCATGKIGLKRQLTVDEISDQVLYFQANGVRADSVSFMGMGEPLANPRVFDTLKLLTDSRAFGLSARRLNISTSGVLPGIKKLNQQHPQVNLAFSLHSPFPEERNILVPANRMYPFSEVFTLLDERIALTGVNDSPEHAKALAALIRDRRRTTRHLYHVSLIEYNDGNAILCAGNLQNMPPQGVPSTLRRADSKRLQQFEEVLDAASISHSRRNYFGRDIDAACGQQFAAYDPEPKRKANCPVPAS
ncbi:GPI transamidase 8, putative [Eimeria mitis]|uniref:GPI transamidase 8, putative n=1 Tax=Eimeria mitis TaxID=44415 RepID=U6KIB2_9EIME|nr:GPI transamidase 8, putative [Eimeria mitis]CDJ35982.1 GPI transamidase 8, putative [Eimeria mitis]